MSSTTEVTSPAPKPIHKSGRRNKKLPLDEASHISTTVAEAAAPPSHTTTCAEKSISANDVCSETPVKVERELLKELSKRLKKSQKKLDSIRKCEEKIKDLNEEEKAVTTLINKDERKKIADKVLTQTVHKELQEIYEKVREQSELEEKIVEERFQEQQRNSDDVLSVAVKKAFEDGVIQGKTERINEAHQKVLTLVKFLRLAGYRRSVPSEIREDDEAIEQVLILVYAGDKTAVETCEKLAGGSDELIPSAQNISFQRIKQLADELQVDEFPEDDPNSGVEAVTETNPDAGAQADSTESTEPNEVSGKFHPETNGTMSEPAPTEPSERLTEEDSIYESQPHINPGAMNDVFTEVADVPPNQTQAPLLDNASATRAVMESEFQSVGHRRGGGRGGRGRGSSEGSSRGYRGRGGFRGDRDHRGRGRGFRGRRGDGNRGRGDNQQ